MGLANSIISGVTEIMKISTKVIVLEDDLLTTPNFLCFMNQSLTKYESNPSVFSISGYSLDLGLKPHKDGYSQDGYFFGRGWSWGWATWKSDWEKVDWNVSDYEIFRKDRLLKKSFARGGSDLNEMLRKQMNGLLDSWAIRWFYHQHKVNGFTLYPVKSKVYNNGFDAMATHTNGSNKRYRPLLDTEHSLDFDLPDDILLDPYYNKKFLSKMGIKSRIKSKIDNCLLIFTGK
jgi:hypothetical protein